MILLFALLKDFLWTAALLYLFARAAPDQLRCESFESALRVSLVHVLLRRLLLRFALVLAVIPAFVLGGVPLVGGVLVVTLGVAVYLAVPVASLWLAQRPFDDFEARDLVVTAGAAIGVGVVRLVGRLLW